MRRKVVAGNWKMNMTPSEAVALVKKLKPNMENSDVDVIFCVPSIDIVPVVEACKGTKISVGAENMYYEEKGAYTGEVSPQMLVDAGVSYVIIGHSERRQYFKEDNEMVNRKIRKAEILQLLMLKPKLAILDETDSGLDVDAVRTVSAGIREYQKNSEGSLLVITHSTKILESLPVDYTHVMVEGKIIKTGGAGLVDEINESGFAGYEAEEHR